ncbi:MAG: 2Fe-2S iron-sulfur cluster-binding protein [Bdellovibrionales bacterium]
MIFLPSKKSIEFRDGESVLELAIAHKVRLAHSCGGMGSCGTCRVFVRSDLNKLSPRTDIEVEMSKDRQFVENERLACQTKAFDGLIVEVPKKKT